LPAGELFSLSVFPPRRGGGVYLWAPHLT
jgi:hypothetical protein